MRDGLEVRMESWFGSYLLKDDEQRDRTTVSFVVKARATCSRS